MFVLTSKEEGGVEVPELVLTEDSRYAALRRLQAVEGPGGTVRLNEPDTVFRAVGKRYEPARQTSFHLYELPVFDRL
jgi:hypothetical protein